MQKNSTQLAIGFRYLEANRKLNEESSNLNMYIKLDQLLQINRNLTLNQKVIIDMILTLQICINPYVQQINE